MPHVPGAPCAARGRMGGLLEWVWDLVPGPAGGVGEMSVSQAGAWSDSREAAMVVRPELRKNKGLKGLTAAEKAVSCRGSPGREAERSGSARQTRHPLGRVGLTAREVRVAATDRLEQFQETAKPILCPELPEDKGLEQAGDAKKRSIAPACLSRAWRRCGGRGQSGGRRSAERQTGAGLATLRRRRCSSRVISVASSST